MIDLTKAQEMATELRNERAEREAERATKEAAKIQEAINNFVSTLAHWGVIVEAADVTLYGGELPCLQIEDGIRIGRGSTHSAYTYWALAEAPQGMCDQWGETTHYKGFDRPREGNIGALRFMNVLNEACAWKQSLKPAQEWGFSEWDEETRHWCKKPEPRPVSERVWVVNEFEKGAFESVLNELLAQGGEIKHIHIDYAPGRYQYTAVVILPKKSN